jgi:hypothetical protein
MIVLLAIAVFFGEVAIDYADSRNTQAVAAGRAHAAARWSVCMYLIGLVGFFAVLRVSWWLTIPECLGLYTGSWIAVRGHRTSVVRNP